MNSPAKPKFVIVTLPRSGSYHLVSLLDSAPDVVCHGELFKSDVVELGTYHQRKLGISAGDVAMRDQDRLAFLTKLRQVNPLKVFGFKIFPGHVHKDQKFNAAVMNQSGWRKIFLFRNPLESYASLLRAKKTGVWVLNNGTSIPDEKLNEPVLFSVDSFEEHMKVVQWHEAIYKKTSSIESNPVARIDYDEMSDHSKIQKLLEFVGSRTKAEALTSKRQRQFSEKFENGFSNWEDFLLYLQSKDLTTLIPTH